MIHVKSFSPVLFFPGTGNDAPVMRSAPAFLLLAFLLSGCAPARAGSSYGPFARADLPPDLRPAIALVIDDMGVDRKHSARVAAELPPQVTLAYLPYARHVREQAKQARAMGHEIIIHMPMEPSRATADPGPDVLSATLPEAELRARIRRDLAAFDGYIGVNNHMGSKFTQNRRALDVLMDELKAKDPELIFLDSRTIAKSHAEQAARDAGLRAVSRDVFLDDEETEAFMEGALEKAERRARRHGSALAIGHPKALTLADLKRWIPELERKGFRLVPLSEFVRLRAR
jgi:uncharacterized protein